MYKNKNVYKNLYTQSYFWWGDNMKIAKTMALIAVGAGAVLAYQKYSEPVMDKIESIADDAMKKAEKKLDDMM